MPNRSSACVNKPSASPSSSPRRLNSLYVRRGCPLSSRTHTTSLPSTPSRAPLDVLRVRLSARCPSGSKNSPACCCFERSAERGWAVPDGAAGQLCWCASAEAAAAVVVADRATEATNFLAGKAGTLALADLDTGAAAAVAAVVAGSAAGALLATLAGDGRRCCWSLGGAASSLGPLMLGRGGLPDPCPPWCAPASSEAAHVGGV